MGEITTIHNTTDLDGAVASWCVEKYKNASVYAINLSKGYPSNIARNSVVYIFGNVAGYNDLASLCSRNELIMVFTKKNIPSNNIKNLKFIKVESSFSRSIAYRLKIPETKIIDSVDCIVQKSHAPGLGRIEEYLKLCIPYNFKTIESTNRTLTERYDDAVNIGRGIAIKIDYDMRDILSRSRSIIFDGYDSLIVNCSINFKKIALLLADNSKSGLGITWRCSDSETFHFTIASTEMSDIDCRSIARRNGGEGSKYKAGFKVASFGTLKSILSHAQPR